MASVHRLVRQIGTDELDIGYVDEGPRHGTAAILLHGWPYDIHTYADVLPLLVEQGVRVVVPYLRGFGTTQMPDPYPSCSAKCSTPASSRLVQ
jgi:pimeloyl-ACP methyl ester carboxylesterase